MIPLRDENPSHSFPVVNLFLITVNCSVFFCQYYYFKEDPGYWIDMLGYVPHRFIHWAYPGAGSYLWTPLTLFTAMFMHGGWMHLLGNMLFLYIFGDNIEDVLGHWRYLVFYLVCGVAATAAHTVLNLNSTVPLVGASGAIAGVLGAYLFLFPGARVNTLFILVIFIRIFRIPAFVLLIYWLAIQIISAVLEQRAGIPGSVAWFAHIGGFMAGLVWVPFLKKKRLSKARWRA